MKLRRMAGRSSAAAGGKLVPGMKDYDLSAYGERIADVYDD